MRPYLAFCAVVVIAVAANGQNMRSRHRRHPHPHPGQGYSDGYSYAPLITTPMLSFETISPNPVGASNATTGLAAGATNATISDLPEGSTSSDYTAAVWYHGGSPQITPEVNTWPIPREPGPMRGYGRGDEHEMMEQERPQEARAGWTYFSGPEYTTDVASAAKGPGLGKHAYTNEDVTRQNEKNGNVHYDGKKEKIR